MGSWVTPAHVQSYSHEQQWQQSAATLEVKLERTFEPVWPEDEDSEFSQPGAARIPFMSDKEADRVLRTIAVKLPDRLIPKALPMTPATFSAKKPGLDQALELAVHGYNHVAFRIPTSFIAPDSLILRRLRLDVVLSANGGIVPVVIFMNPGANVEEQVYKVGEIGVDLGKALSMVLPQIPAMFTARAETRVDVKNVHPKIQASGLLRHDCSWWVADSRIAYDFNPTLMAQFSLLNTLRVSATMRVEVRKRVLGVFHRTYAKNATPVSYVYRPGEPLMPAFDSVEHFRGLGQEDDLYKRGTNGTQAFQLLGKLFEGHDQAQSKNWYRRAADAGDIDAMLKMGQLAGGKNPAEANRWYRRAADAGGSKVMYRIGTQLEEKDRARAKDWYRRAVDTGNIDAMLKMGRLAEGEDPAEANRWYERAADAGGNKVMYRIGTQFEEIDRAQARSWYRRAADSGNINAMLKMGQLTQGEDRAEAARWYRRAADAGSPAGKAALKRIYPLRHSFMRHPSRRRQPPGNVPGQDPAEDLDPKRRRGTRYQRGT